MKVCFITNLCVRIRRWQLDISSTLYVLRENLSGRNYESNYHQIEAADWCKKVSRREIGWHPSLILLSLILYDAFVDNHICIQCWVVGLNNDERILSCFIKLKSLNILKAVNSSSWDLRQGSIRGNIKIAVFVTLYSVHDSDRVFHILVKRQKL